MMKCCRFGWLVLGSFGWCCALVKISAVKVLLMRLCRWMMFDVLNSGRLGMWLFVRSGSGTVFVFIIDQLLVVLMLRLIFSSECVNALFYVLLFMVFMVPLLRFMYVRVVLVILFEFCVVIGCCSML